MRANIDDWTMVIVGDWNVRLLTPEWVAKNLFEGKEIQVEALLRPGDQHLRYNFAEISILPEPDRIIITEKAINDEVLQSAEQVAIKTLELLPHTPIRALGINFGFIEENPGPELTSLFELNDRAELADFDCKTISTEIHRRFETEHGILKLKQTLSDGNIALHLNFHYDVSSIEEAINQLRDRITLYRDFGYKLLDEVYQLTLEEDEQVEEYEE